MDKMQIATEIGRLEGILSRLESRLRTHEREYDSAKGNYTLGGLGLLIGAILLLFFSPITGIFLIIVSVLAAALAGISASGKQSAAQAKIYTTEEKIAQVRSKLAELRAQLASIPAKAEPVTKPKPNFSPNAQNSPVDYCPKCGIPMIIKTANTGAQQGKPFYVCPNYKQCQQFFPVEQS